MNYAFFGSERPVLGPRHKIVEQYDFGDAGGAYKVATDNPSEILDDDRVLGVETKTEFNPRTHFYMSKEGVATIDDVRSLHNVPTDGPSGDGVTVVIMDSGIDDTHPVFSDTSIEKPDPNGLGKGDQVGHGTACAGQVVQLAPDVDLISLRIFGSSGRTGMDKILRAYEWLIQNAEKYDVVNMSWGARQRVAQLDRIHNELKNRGVQDVVAAGNTGGKGGSPATAESAFSAGACTENGSMAPFSSYNPNYDNPDVTAIGVDNRLARAAGTTMGEALDEEHVKASGTSFAAPEVAGMVARFIGAKGGNDTVLKAYEGGARDIEGVPKDGAGLADHTNAMEWNPDDGDDGDDGPDYDRRGRASVSSFFFGYKLLSTENGLLPVGSYQVTQTDGEETTFHHP